MKEVNLCGLPVQIGPRTHLKCPGVCVSLLLLLSMMLQWWVWMSGMWQRSFYYERRVAHQTQLIRIHKAMELLLLSCAAAARSAWEALMRAQSAQECRLKVSRHKHCSGWRGAPRKVRNRSLPRFIPDFSFQTSILFSMWPMRNIELTCLLEQ